MDFLTEIQPLSELNEAFCHLVWFKCSLCHLCHLSSEDLPVNCAAPYANSIFSLLLMSPGPWKKESLWEQWFQEGDWCACDMFSEVAAAGPVLWPWQGVHNTVCRAQTHLSLWFMHIWFCCSAEVALDLVLVRKILKYSFGRKSQYSPLAMCCSGISRGEKCFISKRELFLFYHFKPRLGGKR